MVAVTRALLTSVVAVTVTATCSASLADLALQKVLQDSSQLFGDYESAINSKSNTSQWMKNIPDQTPLVAMNIPGTHDSGTWNVTTALMQDIFVDNNVTNPQDFRCQDQPIAAMLDAGVRFFDLRPALDPTRTYLTIWHGPAEVSQLSSIEDLMFAFYAWLDRHPSETLLLSFQYEGGTVPGFHEDDTFEQILFAMLTSPAAKKYIWQETGALRTLGEVRGKIILFKRFDINFLSDSQAAQLPGLHLSPSLWLDNDANITFVYNETTNATIYVEDHYELGDGNNNVDPASNIAMKVNASISHLDLAANGTAPDSLFITFISSEHIANNPDMTPQAMALGLNNNSTSLGGVNQQVNKYIKSHPGKRFGIVVIDFFETPSDLIKNILSR